VVGLAFPAGEGVAAGDWDGSVRSGAATLFILGGLSVWELGVRKGVGTKADEDYEKRAATPDGTPSTEATYVVAVLRPWTKRAKWSGKRVGASLVVVGLACVTRFTRRSRRAPPLTAPAGERPWPHRRG
jgi:hypothetical protein